MTENLGLLADMDPRLHVESVLDRLWYRHRYPDVAAAGIDPVDHYIACGAHEGRDPHPLFDTCWYLKRHPGLIETRVNPLAHYLVIGADENRDPHPLFNTAWYRDQNPEAAKERINPLVHYLNTGARRSRDPHPLFHTAWYLKTNPDVAQAEINPLAHYVVDGEREGRNPNPLFDTAWYRKQSPELAALKINSLTHYLTIGDEQLLNTHPLFDVAWYLEQIGDQLPSGMTALEHYIRRGAQNRLEPHPLFDARRYLNIYPEVVSAGLNPLLHYLEEGSDYGTEPHILFAGSWYKLHYGREQPLQMNPLVHYLVQGAEQNYDPSPSFSTKWYTTRYRDVNWRETNPLVHYVTTGRRSHRATLPIQTYYREYRTKDYRNFGRTVFEKRRHINLMTIKPSFVIAFTETSHASSQRTLSSIAAQFYAHAEIVTISELRARMCEAHEAPDTYLLWLEPGDILKPGALYYFAAAINRCPELDLIYGDEEVLSDEDGEVLPFFKPAWSPDYLASFNYIGRSVCYRMVAARSHLTSALNPFDLLLRVAESTPQIAHLREMILCCEDRRFGTIEQIQSDVFCLESHSARLGRDQTFVTRGNGRRLYKSSFTGIAPTTLSLVIYDPLSNVDYPESINEGAAKKHRWSELVPGWPDIDIIDLSLNGTRDLQRDSTLRQGKTTSNLSLARRDLAWELNSAIRSTTSEYVLFLQKGIFIERPEILSEMLCHFVDPRVGAVGPKMMLPCGHVLQAGQVFCGNKLQSVHNGSNNGGGDYFYSMSATRNFRSVGLGALLTKKCHLEDVGGFDEQICPELIAADYCFKLLSHQLRVICEPCAEMIIPHDPNCPKNNCLDFELDLDTVFVERWAACLAVEPYYNEFKLSNSPPAYDGRFMEGE